MGNKKTILITVDGLALRASKRGNAIAQASPENIEYYLNNYPVFYLNNESLNGSSPYSRLSLGRKLKKTSEIAKEFIELSTIENNIKIKETIKNCIDHSSSLHLLGIVGDKKENDLIIFYKLLDFIKRIGIQRTYLHLILDFESKNVKIINQVIERMDHYDGMEIATVIGIDSISDGCFTAGKGLKYKNLLIKGIGDKILDIRQLKSNLYERSNEVKASVIVSEGKPISLIDDFDSVIFFNIENFQLKEFTNYFINTKESENRFGISFLTLFDFGIKNNGKNISATVDVKSAENLVDYLSKYNILQIYIVESNNSFEIINNLSNRERSNDFEKWSIVSSEGKDQTEVLDEIVERAERVIEGELYSFIFINFYTIIKSIYNNNITDTINSVKLVDFYLKRIIDKSINQYANILLASVVSGAENLEKTSEKSSVLPLILINKKNKNRKPNKFNIVNMLHPKNDVTDLAPTIIESLNLNIPNFMTGSSLVDYFYENEYRG